jgi:hypothetical protein
MSVAQRVPLATPRSRVGSGTYRHGDSNPGTDPASTGLNELGAPDFQGWRERFRNADHPNGSPPLSCGDGPCMRCGYPLLRSDRECPRCGKARAL